MNCLPLQTVTRSTAALGFPHRGLARKGLRQIDSAVQGRRADLRNLHCRRLADLCDDLDQPFFIANPNGDAWRWSNIKRKTDRDDALKLARMTAMNQLPTVHVSSRNTRAKRSLLKFRQSIVERRVTLQNEIRAVRQAQGLAPLPSGKCGWTRAACDLMRSHGKRLLECTLKDCWRGQLNLLLDQLAYIREQENWLDANWNISPKTTKTSSVC